MTTLLVILGGAMLARMFVRARLRRAWALGHGYRFGGCGRSLRNRHRFPIDLSAPDGYGYGYGGFDRLDELRRRARDFHGWRRSGAVAQPTVDIAGALELNERQKELYDQVLAKAKKSVPAAALAEALIAVGREPFGRDAIELLVGPGELADDFEQLHHSLTPEQREKLRVVTTA